VRVDGQKPDIRRQRRASGQLTAKPISIKGAKRRSGDCAWKAAELTPGDLFRVASATEAVERRPDRAGQKSAEGVLGHDVGKASEALRKPKGGAMDRPSRERWPKARTRRSGQ
jgi:hypothetical protein